MTPAAKRFGLAAGLLCLGFFIILFYFAATQFYERHFFDRGAGVVLYQLMRVLYMPYLVWLQYAVGAYALWRMGGRAFPFVGLPHFIASFLLGTSLWHMLIFALGLAGVIFYPVMLLLAGGVMIFSVPHLASLIRNFRWPAFTRAETFGFWLMIIAGGLFLFIKGVYPSGGHDFFNHYFQYYREVVDTGSLGPHDTWYHYYYSKGLGLYFMSMLLLDPLAVHLVGMSFVILSASVVYDMLQRPGASRLLAFFGVVLFFMCYIPTNGRGLFAANGGWGDLEKTHELTATLILGCIWAAGKALSTRSKYHAVVLYAATACNAIIGFAAALVAGSFFAGLLVWRLARRDMAGARVAFTAGAVTGAALVMVLVVNYLFTGLPQDQMADIFWPVIDWQKVVKLGYTLELYSHFWDLMTYSKNAIPFFSSIPKMLVEYNRLYLLWPLLALGALLYATRKRFVPLENGAVVLCFIICSFLFALFFGGRSQVISYFRFSTFNYAPALILCLLLWTAASQRLQKFAVFASVILALGLFLYGGVHAMSEERNFTAFMSRKANQWKLLVRAAYRLNTGGYSLRDAITDQYGRVGRLKWGGQYPAMQDIYAHFPEKTKIWSTHNHSYCLMPNCKVQQYFSQVTLRRWYDVAEGSIEEGKKIMQEEGLNFIFYSRSVPVIFAADAKDQLAGFYKGLYPENIEKTYGVLWTNGWDYLLTWKEESVAPLDAEFMDSWKLFYEKGVMGRQNQFPTRTLAPMIKKAAQEPTVKHPPVPEW